MQEHDSLRREMALDRLFEPQELSIELFVLSVGSSLESKLGLDGLCLALQLLSHSWYSELNDCLWLFKTW